MRIYFEGPLILIAVFVWIAMISLLKFKYKRTNMNIFFLSLFYIYIVELLNYTQFPITYVPELQEGFNLQNYIYTHPFIIHDMKNAILNVIMTIPFGFLLPMVKKINFHQILFWAFCIPIILEGTQLLIAVITKYSERIIDINDFIFNLLGILLGFVLFKISIILMKKIEVNSLLKYINNL